jgi:hypothetical protein
VEKAAASKANYTILSSLKRFAPFLCKQAALLVQEFSAEARTEYVAGKFFAAAQSRFANSLNFQNFNFFRGVSTSAAAFPNLF